MIESDTYQALINQGRNALQQGQIDVACRNFMAAADLAASDPTKLNEIGITLTRLRGFSLARDIFTKVIAINPDNAVANAHLGSILLHLGEPARAEKHLQAAILIFPSDPNFLFNLAQAFQFQKKIKSALVAYRKAAELGRSISPHFHAHLATLLEITNKLDELGQVLNEALAIFPDDTRLNFLMAKYARRQGDHEAALKRLTSSLLKNPIQTNVA